MRNEPKRDEDAYAQVVTAHNDAVAELEFALKFLTGLGVALGKGRRIRLHPIRAGVEIRSLYPSPADALAAATQVRHLLALVSLGEHPEALPAFAAYAAAIEAAQPRA
jgi:hypothetical protein